MVREGNSLMNLAVALDGCLALFPNKIQYSYYHRLNSACRNFPLFLELLDICKCVHSIFYHLRAEILFQT